MISASGLTLSSLQDRQPCLSITSQILIRYRLQQHMHMIRHDAIAQQLESLPVVMVQIPRTIAASSQRISDCDRDTIELSKELFECVRESQWIAAGGTSRLSELSLRAIMSNTARGMVRP